MNLPDGEETHDEQVYLRVWQELGEPVAALTGWRLTGFDPEFVYTSPDGQTVTLSPAFVESLIAGLKLRGSNKKSPALTLKRTALRTAACVDCGAVLHQLGKGRPRQYCPDCLRVRKKLREP